LSLGSVILTGIVMFFYVSLVEEWSFPIINHQFDAALSEYLRDQNEMN
jgi:hypothetical protein